MFWGVGGNCSNGFCYYRTFKYDGRFGPQLRTLVYCLPDGCLLVLPAALLPGLVVTKKIQDTRNKRRKVVISLYGNLEEKEKKVA